MEILSLRREDWKDLKPTIYGWGIKDINYKISDQMYQNGKSTRIWTCPYYDDWCSVIERGFSKLLQNKYPSYKNCTIHEDWKYLSNFIKWVDSQPNKDWQNCQLDKDFLIEGNKHYGPDTCVYITGELNKFITDTGKLRGKTMLGVSIDKRKVTKQYSSHCKDPFTKKKGWLGYYSTDLEAHKAWQAKKHEHALKLADLQNDPRVADALRQRYAPDKDWTNK